MALLAEFRDFARDGGDADAVPSLSLGLFYRALEQQLGFSRTDAIQHRDAQTAAATEIYRPGDFEDAVKKAYKYGSGHILFEVLSLSPS